MWIVPAGVAIGLASAVAGVRLLASFLYGVGARDPVTFIAVPIVVGLVAAIACIVPAPRGEGRPAHGTPDRMTGGSGTRRAGGRMSIRWPPFVIFDTPCG